MKLVYFGTAEFAVPALEALSEHIVLVVSQQDRPSGRGMKLRPSPVKSAALALGLPVETPEKSRSPEFVERIRTLNADALVVAAYGQILSTKLLESAARGGINLHGSILPAWRGAAPIQRSIQHGDTESGVTLMQMDRGMDTGDIIEIARTPIGPDETYGELQGRLAQIASELVQRWMPKIVAGDYPRTPQPEEGVSLAPKVSREECELSVQRPAQEEYNRFRAFTPSPGVFLRTSHGQLKILEARLAEDVGEPGTLLGKGLTVAFQGGALRLTRVQPEGKKAMGGVDYSNGMRLLPGSKLV